MDAGEPAVERRIPAWRRHSRSGSHLDLTAIPRRRSDFPSKRTLGVAVLLLVVTFGMVANVWYPAGGWLSSDSLWGGHPPWQGSSGRWRTRVRLTTEGLAAQGEPEALLRLSREEGRAAAPGSGPRRRKGPQKKDPLFQRARLVLNISALSCMDEVEAAIDSGWEEGSEELRWVTLTQPTLTSPFKQCAQPRPKDGIGQLRHVFTLRSARPRREKAITLLTHLSLARLPMLENQCRSWPGPIAAAVYMPLVDGRMFLNDTAAGNPWPDGNPWGSMEALTKQLNGSTVSQGMELLYFFHRRMEKLAAGKNGSAAAASCTLDLTFVVEERCNAYLAGLYPINAVRNRMILLARTDAVALLDVDFVPSRSLAQGLGSSRLGYAWLMGVLGEHRAIVLPAFQTSNRNGQLKSGIRQALATARAGKQAVLERLANRTLTSFEKMEYGRGHRATNYTLWRRAAEPYAIQYTDGYEPYLLLHRDHLPWYDERFRGYGWDKVVHTFHLANLGLEFVVHPTAFLVHVPHARAANQAITADTGHRVILGRRFHTARAAILGQMYRPTVSLPEVCT